MLSRSEQLTEQAEFRDHLLKGGTMPGNDRLFLAVIENTYDAVTLRDADGFIIYQSPSTMKIIGYSVCELNEFALSVIHSEDIEGYRQRMDMVMNSPGLQVYGTHRVKHKMGHYIWVEGTISNLLEDENVRAIVSNFRDITERKLAEKKAKQTEKRFQAILENNYDAIALLDNEGNISYQSPASARMLGYTDEEIMGKPAIAFFHPDDVADIVNRLETAIQNPGKPIYRVNRMRHKDGHYIWAEGTTTNLLDDENVRAIVGNFRDITERKLAEERVGQNEKRFRALIENNFDVVMLSDAAGNITYQSPATKRILGYSPGEVDGKKILEFYHPEERAGIAARLEGALINPGVPINSMNLMRHKDGRYIWTEGTIINLLEDENVSAIVYNFRDITEVIKKQKQIEFDQKNLNALINNTRDLMWSVDTNYKLITSNRAFDDLVKHLTGNYIAQGGDVLAIGFNEHELVHYKKLYARAFAGETFKTMEHTNTAEAFWSELSFYPIRKGGDVIGTACYSHNITKTKLAEKKIIYANRLYAFISGINQIIVHSKDEKVVFDEACRIAVDIGKFKMAWIGTTDKKEQKINRVASYGICDEDLRLFANVTYDTNGPQDRALSATSYYVCNDIENDLETTGWKPFARKYGINSCMVMPIKRSGMVTGTLNLYSTELNFFDEQEILLLQEIAGDISFSLDVFEKERHRKEMEDEVKHSEKRLKQAQAIAHVGSWELNYATGIADWSEEFCRIYGLDPADNIQTYSSWISFIHPEDLVLTKNATNEARHTSSNFAFHHRIIRKDGAIRHIYSQAEFEFDEDGSPIWLHGVASDLTETKEAEEKLSKTLTHLVQRNNDLEEFSQIVSHKLRAPVANILGLVNVIQTIGIAQDENEVIGFLGTAATNLDNVIRNLNYILEEKEEIS